MTQYATASAFKGGGGASSVDGPVSATDNAIARYDGTTGKILQDSAVTIADSTGNMAGVGTLNTHTIQGGTGTLALTTDITGTNSGTNTGDEAAASPTVSGIAELATIAEIDTGSDTVRTITPAGLAGSQNQTDTDANTSKVSADGLVTTHSDVTNAGSGIIISAAERTAIGTNTTNNAGSATVHSDIAAGDITNLGNLSGTNTGDQTFDGLSPMTTGGDIILSPVRAASLPRLGADFDFILQ